jgi:uncharacterized membrane protein SpoIIM required for sporulation
MTIRSKHIFPGTFELISLVVVSILVVVLGNSRQLLDYYGLSSTNQVLKQGAGDTIAKGLTQLDSFSFTGQVVTFLIWAVVGLLCFSVAQAIARGYQEFQREEELSSNRYIHPSTFRRSAFWKSVGWNFATVVAGLTLLGLALYGMLAYVLPIGLTYTQVFLQGVSVLHLGYFLLGLAVIYVGLIILDCCLRLLTHRRQIIS